MTPTEYATEAFRRRQHRQYRNRFGYPVPGDGLTRGEAARVAVACLLMIAGVCFWACS